MSVALHRKAAPASVTCFVLTISDTRTPETDASGNAIVELLTTAGPEGAGRPIAHDDPRGGREIGRRQATAVQVIITTGGTGITARDSTYEAIMSAVDKRLGGAGGGCRLAR